MREDFDSLFNKFFGKKKRLESFDEEQDMQPIDDLIDKLNSFHVVTEDTQNSICLLYTSPSPRD